MPLIPLAIAALFALWGIIKGIIDQVVQVLVRPLINHLNALDPDVPLAPADAADAVERNILSRDLAAGEAASSGVSGGRFDWMVLLTGEPPGIEQMLSLWRRGLLDTATLDRMIAYSRIRTEWTNHVKDLAHETMSAADAIEAVLKGVVSHDQGEAWFVQAGGLQSQFDTLLSTAGNPIGVEQALTLYNHGMINDEQVSQVILHSRVNPQFEGIAKLLRYKFIPAFQIAQILKSGSATAQEATSWLTAEGYPADQVAAFVHYATAGKTVTHKNATEAMVAEAFDAGILTRAQADAELVALGYEPGEVDFILSLYDYKRSLAMSQAAIGQVRKVFLARRIDKTTASNMLDSLGVDPFARDHYLQIWEVEQGSELRELSAAQVGGMYKKGLLTDNQAMTRWEQMGYSAPDQTLLLANYGGPPPPGSPAAQQAATSGG